MCYQNANIENQKNFIPRKMLGRLNWSRPTWKRKSKSSRCHKCKV